jgi:hypothetical protein
MLRELVTPDDMNTQLRDNLRYLTAEMPVGVGYIGSGITTTSTVWVEVNPNARVTLDIQGTRLYTLLSFQWGAGAEVVAGSRIELAIDNTIFTGSLWGQNGKASGEVMYWCTIHRLFTGLTPGTHSIIPRIQSVTAGNNNFAYAFLNLTAWGL